MSPRNSLMMLPARRLRCVGDLGPVFLWLHKAEPAFDRGSRPLPAGGIRMSPMSGHSALPVLETPTQRPRVIPAGRAYVRVSITDRCNLRCRYCMPEQGVQLSARREHADIDEHIEAIARLDEQVGVRKIRITGGEPLVRKDVVELVRRIRERFAGAELCMTTNAVLLDRFAQQLADAGLDRVNISIDSLRRDRFEDITRRDDLSAVLRGIDAAFKAGLGPVKFNAVLLRALNLDEYPELVRFAVDCGGTMRFIELMEIGESGYDHSAAFVSADEAFSKIDEVYPSRWLEGLHGVARPALVTIDGVEHEVGFIRPVTEPFCSTCDRMRVDTLGRVHSCLMGEDPQEADIAANLFADKTEPTWSWRRVASMSSIGG